MQPTIWGGHRISELKDTPIEGRIGESWEISGVPGKETTVADGPHAGLTLSQLVAEEKELLVGKANYERFGNRFPLLVKLIDAHHDLSIQVHPDDETAHRHGYPMGKSEMWYVMPSTPGAKLFNGLRKQLDGDTFKQMIARKTVTEALAQYAVNEGDVFFIPAGRIHAIGEGCMVAEIQQTSDVTYRIYDYDRRDKNGQPRELHVEKAVECIDYRVAEDYRTHYEPCDDQRVKLVDCPYFLTSIIDVAKGVELDVTALDSFIILMAVQGEGTVAADGESASIKAGQTLLLPATTRHITLSGSMRLLETMIVQD